MTEEHEDIGHLITGLTTAAARAAELSLAPFMLSPLEYKILDRCHRGEANTVTELSRVFPVDASVMSRLVSKLVDRKLIGRQRLSSDRRTVRLSLTEEGRFLAQRLDECMKTNYALLMNGVSDDEWTAFKAAAYKIMTNMEDGIAPSLAKNERDDATRPGVFRYTAPEAKGLKNGRSNAVPHSCPGIGYGSDDWIAVRVCRRPDCLAQVHGIDEYRRQSACARRPDCVVPVAAFAHRSVEEGKEKVH